MTRAETLTRLVNALHWRSGVEIGLMRGETFLRLLQACPDLHMIGVGLWTMAPTRDEHFEALNQIAGNRATLLRASLEEAASGVMDGSLDFVLVNPRLPADDVLSVVTAWRPKVKPGGLILF